MSLRVSTAWGFTLCWVGNLFFEIPHQVSMATSRAAKATPAWRCMVAAMRSIAAEATHRGPTTCSRRSPACIWRPHHGLE